MIEKTTWQPIETAPTDNKRPLYLAQFKNGILRFVEVDGRFQHSNTQYEDRCWKSSIRFNSCSSQMPTHWSYQDYPIPQVPSGWQLVPIDPTEKMTAAYWEAIEQGGKSIIADGPQKIFAHRYKAMLEAAPQPPEGEI